MTPLIDADVLEYKHEGLYWKKSCRGRPVGKRVGSVNGAGYRHLNRGRGYSFCPRTQKFRARYCPTINGKQTTITIEYFDTPEEASIATAAYKEKLFAGRERRM